MDTADILFIAAEPMEFSGAMRFWSAVEPVGLPVHWARRAGWKGKRILAIANGAGPKRSAAACGAASYKQLINLGYCGALDPKLKIGDIVVSESHLPVHSSLPHFTGRMASIDHIAQTAEEKRHLHSSGRIAVEMESAGLGDVPFYCIKSVSDLADESFANDLNSCLRVDGRMDIPKLLAKACLRPVARFSELIRLQKRAKLASKALGEFLESCEF
jgi:hypothetical protein